MSVATRCATNKRSSKKCQSRLDVRLIRGRVQIMGHRLCGALFSWRLTMELYSFYFIQDTYFQVFTDPYLMRNHKVKGSKQANRPYFFSFRDEETGLFWMIPVSSQIEKYEIIYQRKLRRIGKCETIMFANF